MTSIGVNEKVLRFYTGNSVSISDYYENNIHYKIFVNTRGGIDVVNMTNGFIPTMEAYNKAEIGQEYTGYRRSKWMKLDPNDYSNLTGKIYQDSRI